MLCAVSLANPSKKERGSYLESSRGKCEEMAAKLLSGDNTWNTTSRYRGSKEAVAASEFQKKRTRWADIASDDDDEEERRVDSLEVDNCEYRIDDDLEDRYGPKIDMNKGVLQSIEGPLVSSYEVPESHLRQCGGRRLVRHRPQGERRDVSLGTELMTTAGAPRIIIVLRPVDRRCSRDPFVRSVVKQRSPIIFSGPLARPWPAG